MEAIEQEKLLEKTREDSEFVRARLQQMKDKYSIIGDVRGIGLLWGVELVTNHITKERAYDAAEQVLYQCLNQD